MKYKAWHIKYDISNKTGKAWPSISIMLKSMTFRDTAKSINCCISGRGLKVLG